MKQLIGNDWDIVLSNAFKSGNYKNLRRFLIDEYKSAAIYPDMHNIFSALKLTSPENVKVVIIGQDPYINEGQAHGLAFSVREGTKLPPSLVNIFKELKNDLGYDIPKSGCLDSWAKEGVLLLNSVLTVRAGLSNSHAGKGWEQFTDEIIRYLGSIDRPIVFMLWGRNAQAKEKLIKNSRQLVLKAAHPSPLSAFNGFFGCKHFSKANEFLKSSGVETVNWKL